MPRCHPASGHTHRATRRTLFGGLCATLGAPALTSLLTLAALPAQAQTARPVPIPVHTLRGDLTFGLPPDVALGSKATRLAPASRIRGQSNTLVMSGSLTGQTHTVNYTVDQQTGLLQDIWLLTPQEAARRWPTTREEASTWSFDPVSQSWSKP